MMRILFWALAASWLLVLTIYVHDCDACHRASAQWVTGRLGYSCVEKP